MQDHRVNNKLFFLPVKTILTITIIMLITGVLTSSFENKEPLIAGNTSINNNNSTDNNSSADSNTFIDNMADSIASVTAFKIVYKVLMSPRCMNCHPSGNIPLQGEDSHLHAMYPKRGTDGKGVYAMKCANCHQPANVAGLHTPPGNPKWHLPPAGTPMVFQGRTARQLAKQLVDPKQNGNKNKQQLIAHASDGLVTGAWNPGEGRKLPPMSHQEFAKAWITWINKGAYAPK